jgi:peroxiredoxin
MILLGLLTVSCSKDKEPTAAVPYSYAADNPYAPAGPGRDDAQTNANVAAGALEITLTDSKGQPIDLKKYRGQKNIVLVVMRGYPGYVCPNCSAQTSRLIRHYSEITARDAEVLVVFPGPSEHLKDFVSVSQNQAANAEVPFPVLLDEKFTLVDRLGIRGNLAKPSTYILDKQGDVRFAFVGATSADRPSVKALLQQLDAIPKS